MQYAGVDCHKKSSYVTVVDEHGRIVKRGAVSNTWEALAAFLGAGAGEMAVVLEAGRNWPVMYDWLEALVKQVTLAHPAKVRVIAEAKVKTDRVDSEKLAQLLRADWVPVAYVPGPVMRQRRHGAGWEVIEIASSDLDDIAAMRGHLRRLARGLGVRETGQRVRETEEWFGADSKSVADGSGG